MGRTIQDVVDTIVAAIPGAPIEGSVDTFITGDPGQEVTGIVTTFIATVQVIQRAAALGANLIITHEPTYYENRDHPAWLEDDAVCQAKTGLLQQAGITIWRLHDYWHWRQPDGILTGLAQVLGWQDYHDPDDPTVFQIPPMTLSELAAWLKAKMGASVLRVVGRADVTCRRVVILVGAMPGNLLVACLGQEGVDVLICGEASEWQLWEYARDASALGQNKALIILGHEPSEEPGMRYLAEWLRPMLPGVAITHVPAGDCLSYM